MDIILADPNPQTLWALKTLLNEIPEMHLVGEANDANSLLILVTTQIPDLILLDIELPGKSIEDLIVALHNNSSRPFVVGMSTKPEYGRMALKMGADAFVSKSDHPEWLIEVLRRLESRTHE